MKPGGGLLGLAVLLCALSALASARDSFRVEYFDIHGATARELRADLSRKGPMGETGIRGDGYTEYRIGWKFSMTANDGVCRANAVVVNLDVTMRLPRWPGAADAPHSLRETWQQFSKHLREHEDGHHRLAELAARDVRRALKKRHSAASCEALEARLNTAANKVLRAYRDRQADFDRDTDFGRSGSPGLL